MSGFSAYIDSIKTAASAAADEITNEKIGDNQKNAFDELNTALTTQENSNNDVETKYLAYLNTFGEEGKK